jgi:hypothetical protein
MINAKKNNSAIRSQDFFCHFNCFKKKIDPKAKVWEWPKPLPNLSKEKEKMLIQAIIDFKSINSWKFINFGLKEGIINNNFAVDFAVEWLNQDKDADRLILELAGLLENQFEEVPKLFDKNKLEEPNENEKVLYRQKWLYLMLDDSCLAPIF